MILLFAWKAISYITLSIDNSYEYAYRVMDYSNVWCLKIAQKKMKKKYGWKFISMVNIHIFNYIYIFYYMILYQRSNKYKNNWFILK